jgi:hypothetical protein
MSKDKIIENKASKEDDFKDLIFMKVMEPMNVLFIPKEYIENVKGRTFDVMAFYQYQYMQIKNQNPNNLLYLLVNKKNEAIKGFLWCEVNALDGSLFINTYSVSKEYWDSGKMIKRVTDFLDKFVKKERFPRVYWMTTNAKFFLKHGFSKSKQCLMEYRKDS